LALIQRGQTQRVARRQPVHRFQVLAWYSSSFAADHQPGADMLGQHHHGFFVQQPWSCALQVGREFAVQAFRLW
jgi:hypothetical protein